MHPNKIKIRHIVPILLMICPCIAATAQDVIVTKDSREIHAESLEISPRMIKYKIYGKPNMPAATIPIKDVEYIIYDADTYNGDTVRTDNIKTIVSSKKKKRPFISGSTIHYRIESSFSYDYRNFMHSVTPVRLSAGYQIRDYVFLGIGADASFFFENVIANGTTIFESETKEYFDEIPKYKFSGFGIIRFSFPITKKVVTFLDFEGGYSVSPRLWNDEWYGSPIVSGGFGFCFSHIEISGGYEQYLMPQDRMYKPFERWTYYDESSHSNGTFGFGNFYIKIGVKIGHLSN